MGKVQVLFRQEDTDRPGEEISAWIVSESVFGKAKKGII